MTSSNVSFNQTVESSTKERILRAAESLFAENGFDATSHRMITAAAGVNLAAVNYHFHSKDDLIRAVLARRIGPVNQRRLELLREHLAAAGEAPPSLEGIIRAFVEPVVMLRKQAECSGVGRLFGRTYVEPSGIVRKAFFELMREIGRPFTEAFRRALGDLPQVEFLWRMHFSVGVLAHTLAGTEHLATISGGLCDPSDAEGIVDRIVAFIAAGMRAPLPEKLNRS
ncbi:MAG: TetR/AcrR family transcriptional regulator [Bryobacteraceae bacterium]